MLELGFASIDITPTCPVDLIGFSNRRSSQGVAQPLIAQVAVLRMDGFSCLLAAIDHIGFGIEHALRLRQNLGKLIGVEAEQVMLCFSHTHAAPNDSAEPEWADWADTRILSAARRALGGEPMDFPASTAVGALAHYISNEAIVDFQPMNMNFGILPPITGIKGKRERHQAAVQRGKEDLLATMERYQLWV